MLLFFYSRHKFLKNYRILQVYMRILNLSLGPFVLPEASLFITCCTIVCTNTMFKMHLSLVEYAMHANLVVLYIFILLLQVLTKICWFTDLPTEKIKLQKWRTTRKLYRKEFKSLPKLYYWFGYFGIANKELYFLIKETLISLTITVLLT